jgi:hypothetical protein
MDEDRLEAKAKVEDKPVQQYGSTYAEQVGRSAAGPSAPPFRGQAAAAGNLDLLVEMDEPLELMLELEKIARERLESAHERWKDAWNEIAWHAGMAITQLKLLNEPSRQR